MKKVLLLAFLIPVLSFAQTNRTTNQAGDFYNPLIWTPIGLPASGDILTINHAVNMNLDIYYTAGEININSGGSLIEDATPRSMWINGGSLSNAGTYSSHLIWVSSGGSVTNTGTMTGIDSLLADGSVTNNGSAAINDLWITVAGSLNNTGTLTNTDSMLVQGTFINSGSAGVYDIAVDQLGLLDNSGALDISNNFHTQGLVENTGTIDAALDFSNCNTQSMDAMFINDGVFCVGNDFLNCDGDTLTGSGAYYVGNLSSNLGGALTGTHTFNTPTGGLTLNTGTVDVTVTMGTGTCYLGSTGNMDLDYELFPNPTAGNIELSITNVDYQLFDYTGKKVQSGAVENYTLDLSKLVGGMYILKIEGAEVQRILKK